MGEAIKSFSISLIKYTIGLILPWWITGLVVHSMDGRFKTAYGSAWFRWTIGLVLPWWVCAIQGKITNQ